MSRQNGSIGHVIRKNSNSVNFGGKSMSTRNCIHIIDIDINLGKAFFLLLFGRRVPSLLEYFGYMFHHSMLLAGPVCSFKDYMDFIEGRDIARATNQVSGISL